MAFFILEIVFFLSVGAIVYLIARKLPVLEGLWEYSEHEKKNSASGNSVVSRMLDGADKKVNTIFARSLRRMKLLLMKMDNWVGGRLESIRDKNSGDETERPHVLRDSEEKVDEQEK